MKERQTERTLRDCLGVDQQIIPLPLGIYFDGAKY
jgi:hypothetical protein